MVISGFYYHGDANLSHMPNTEVVTVCGYTFRWLLISVGALPQDWGNWMRGHCMPPGEKRAKMRRSVGVGRSGANSHQSGAR